MKRLILAVVIGVLLLSGYVRVNAEPDMGSTPIVYEWQKNFIEIYWPDVPVNADEYVCSYDLMWSGYMIRQNTDTWVIDGNNVYIGLGFDYNGRKWYLTNLDCDARFGTSYYQSPRNTTYYTADFRPRNVFIPMVRRR